MVGDSFTMPRRTFTDERTGREVWQVTSGEFECVGPYMECHGWTADDRYLIFCGNRSGTWQPYRLDLATGEATHLLDAVNANFRSVNLDPLTGEVYCESDRCHWAVNIETLEARLAVDWRPYIPQPITGGKGFTPVLSGDARWAAMCYRTPDGGGALVFAPTDGSNAFEQVPLDHPEIVPGHLQFCPGDDRLVSFCASADRQNDPQEQPFLRAREYRATRPAGDTAPLVLMPPGFRATHCVWGRGGARMYFHRKTVPTWVPTAVCSVDQQGEDLRVYYETSDYKLGHCCASPGERWLAVDSQDVDENILLLAHLERDEQHLLCWPNMSMGSDRADARRPDLPPHTDRHIHPVFSETGRYVSFNSDETGNTHLYVIPVDDLVRPGE